MLGLYFKWTRQVMMFSLCSILRACNHFQGTRVRTRSTALKLNIQVQTLSSPSGNHIPKPKFRTFLWRFYRWQWCWWHRYVEDHFEMLEKKQIMLMILFCLSVTFQSGIIWLINNMLESWCLAIDIDDLSPTSHTCH